MWKVAGSSGQLALGKKFAGRLFEAVFHADGRVELLGVRVVLARQPVADADVSVADGWLPQGAYSTCNAWARDNRVALEAYALRIARDGTAAEQMQADLESPPADGGA